MNMAPSSEKRAAQYTIRSLSDASFMSRYYQSETLHVPGFVFHLLFLVSLMSGICGYMAGCDMMVLPIPAAGMINIAPAVSLMNYATCLATCAGLVNLISWSRS